MKTRRFSIAFHSIPVVALAALGLLVGACSNPSQSPRDATNQRSDPPPPTATLRTAIFAGGCFWCVESAFDDLPGVVSAESGYTGGPEKNPTYMQVGSGKTGHMEAVRVRYDPTRISYAELLEVFWRNIDPTDDGGQFHDRGSQYRTAIFTANARQRELAKQSKRWVEGSRVFSKPIATRILPAGPFWVAEKYHQDYHRKHPIEYKRYRIGSGREAFIARYWKPLRSSFKPKGVAAAPAWMRYRKPPLSQLQSQLTALQYNVTQQEGTERAFANAYWNNHAAGIYVDVLSGEPLFSSRDKFDSGTGWPSFTRPLVTNNVVTRTDRSHGMIRVEVRSRYGDNHLGHRFPDGPAPTGLRYCINSAALRFIPKAKMAKMGYGKYLDDLE